MLFQVWDTGIGIPQEKLTEIFIEFKRLPSRKRKSNNGLGLGLAIVDKISRILGHKIYVESEPGKGSVFSILVPFGELESASPSTEKEGRHALKDTLSNSRILVIDNDLNICAGMETLLASWGCHVKTATGINDLNQDDFKNQCPDLVIADYHLDNGEIGINAIETLREWIGHPVPTLMITANYTQELKQQVRECGYHLLYKPIKPHKLKSMLRYLLQ